MEILSDTHVGSWAERDRWEKSLAHSGRQRAPERGSGPAGRQAVGTPHPPMVHDTQQTHGTGPGAESSLSPKVTQGRVCQGESPVGPQRDPGGVEKQMHLSRTLSQDDVARGVRDRAGAQKVPQKRAAPAQTLPTHPHPVSQGPDLPLFPGAVVSTRARLSNFSSGPRSLCSVATWLWATWPRCPFGCPPCPCFPTSMSTANPGARAKPGKGGAPLVQAIVSITQTGI